MCKDFFNKKLDLLGLFILMADTTRLELATSAVTGRRSNQLSYRAMWWGLQGSNL